MLYIFGCGVFQYNVCTNNTDEFPKSSASSNIGLGFEYFLTNKMALYSTIEQYIETHKGNYGFWESYAYLKTFN